MNYVLMVSSGFWTKKQSCAIEQSGALPIHFFVATGKNKGRRGEVTQKEAKGVACIFIRLCYNHGILRRL